MAEVSGMTPARIAQEITTETTNLKTYVDSELSKKVDITKGSKPGQVLRWSSTGTRWSWLDQYTNLYDNKY